MTEGGRAMRNMATGQTRLW